LLGHQEARSVADRGARHGPARFAQRGFRAVARTAERQDRARSRHGAPAVHADLRASHQDRMIPSSILFVCSQNAVRSPMAEALANRLYGRSSFIDSAGVHAGDLDAFAEAALDEVGIDVRRRHAKSFDDVDASSFDLIVTLSPEAHHQALEATRGTAAE